MSRVLVIEDSPTQAEELRLILESDGLAVKAVRDGQAGLDCLAAAPFDLVLTDVLLPGIDGYEVCRRVKTDPRLRSIPIVLLTVLNDPLDILRGLECGADNFLTKPYDPAFLLSRVRSILANPARRAGRAPEPGVTLSFRGRGLTITSDKEQIVDLLLSTVEDSIRAREREHEARVAKEALERSERFIRSALDALPTRVAVLDGKGTILTVNAAWRRPGEVGCWLGAGCAVGDSYLAACETSPLAEGAALAGGVRAVLAGERDGFALEHTCPGPDGASWFASRVARVEDGGPVRVVVTHEDTTAGKRLEEALRQRAAELAEDSRRRREFQAMMAHELRNPLAPILGGLHVARQAGATPQVREQALDAAERQARHLGRLVDDLLDASRLELGKVALRADRLDLARLVREAAEDRRHILERAGLQLVVAGPETPLWVKGDAARLYQVVANLLDNAKFTDPGGQMEVRVTASPDRRQAVLTVRDTGIGMAPDVLAQLFQPFRQADHSLDRSRGGLGLGLSVVKGLVDLHGGEVSAASEGPGRGAEFTVRLPLEAEPAALSAPSSPARPAGRRRRVLIVEDNRDAADSLRVLLELLGHEVRVAYNGPDGVQAAQEFVPDIVLCDIGLPGLDGYGVARALRLHPTTSRVRLLALTGYGSEEDQRRTRLAGFDVHLTKPADPEELQRHLLTTEA
jgi:signal transduction histidine kinase/DNA-binding response OmpR family regulator